ncbi:MFS transporter [Trinickia fusca]|uniref:MFS transporter n=1 Tax=Trinickia fusca TaxID=2419777 RepID=A0A494X542_9BURK|nr:MFS transporter [Trinickia fusca]RKP43284.1 MFS transporter [Trinickia fusca]
MATFDSTTSSEATSRLRARFPLSGLLALATAAFIGVLTEALPAGLLRQMSVGLGVSDALTGQLVTLYAIGTLLTAIPLTAATQGFRRRSLLLAAIAGLAVTNMITALSTHYVLTLAARFLAGVSVGLLWALVAGYATRMVDEHSKGKAMAIAMTGIPLALSIGIPAGTFIGTLVGWRMTFGILSVATVLLLGWARLALPDFPGQSANDRLSLGEVFVRPGIRSVLFITMAYVLAHNLLYTYIAPFLALSNLADRVDVILFVFGLVALAGLWITGALIDRWMRLLMLASTTLFVVAALAFAYGSGNPLVVYASVGAWGLAWGGAPTLFQTASAKIAGEAAEVAQSMIVTVWNVAMAGAGIVGGALLGACGAASLPWAMVALLFAAGAVAYSAKALDLRAR